MPVDLGGVFRFVFKSLDENGNPADAGTVTVTITLPDGTTQTPAVTTVSTGVYHADFVTTVIGRHLARATGTNDFAYGPDAFHVRDTAGEIIGLVEAKAQLNDAGDDDDEEIRDYLSAATYVCEHFVGSVVRRTVTETYDGGRPEIVLRSAPAVSVTTVTESGTVLAPANYSLSDAGVLRRVQGRHLFDFEDGVDNIAVTYVAGRTVVTPNVRLAARLLLQHWWATQRQGANMARLSGDEVLTIPGVAWSIPIRVTQLLDADTIGGFA